MTKVIGDHETKSSQELGGGQPNYSGLNGLMGGKKEVSVLEHQKGGGQV